MKDYTVHFRCYSEEYGCFDEINVKVEAENQFEARYKAWLLSENNDNFAFMSNLKICGITWEASPLNMDDYFNAKAAYTKYRMGYIKNVDQPNSKIQNSSDFEKRTNNQLCQEFGSLFAIDEIAKDFGKAHGLTPPSLNEEFHFAKKIVDFLHSKGEY